MGGDLGLAEDAVQDAFAAAAADWPRRGVPDRPGAWLTVTARRKAIDRLRAERSQAERAQVLERLVRFDDDDSDDEDAQELSAVADDRLRLDVHLLPSGARARGAGRADAARRSAG